MGAGRSRKAKVEGRKRRGKGRPKVRLLVNGYRCEACESETLPSELATASPSEGGPDWRSVLPSKDCFGEGAETGSPR